LDFSRGLTVTALLTPDAPKKNDTWQSRVNRSVAGMIIAHTSKRKAKDEKTTARGTPKPEHRREKIAVRNNACTEIRPMTVNVV
jgi:hypothetical protein